MSLTQQQKRDLARRCGGEVITFSCGSTFPPSQALKSRYRVGQHDACSDHGPVTVIEILSCKCAIDGLGEVIPAACQVHGVPCDGCGEIEACAPECEG